MSGIWHETAQEMTTQRESTSPRRSAGSLQVTRSRNSSGQGGFRSNYAPQFTANGESCYEDGKQDCDIRGRS